MAEVALFACPCFDLHIQPKTALWAFGPVDAYALNLKRADLAAGALEYNLALRYGELYHEVLGLRPRLVSRPLSASTPSALTYNLRP